MSRIRLAAYRIVREVGGLRRLQRIGVRDLVEAGARWIAPGEIGDIELGLFTSHAAEPLAHHLMGDPDPLVMPLPRGPDRGRAVTPIHPAAPRAAARDEKLYRLLVITDAFRIGRARDREDIVAVATEVADLADRVRDAGLAPGISALWLAALQHHGLGVEDLSELVQWHLHPIDAAEEDRVVETLVRCARGG